MANDTKHRIKTETIIGMGTSITGGLQSSGSLRIEGNLSGEIRCEGDVIIGKSSITHSNITARNVSVEGEVHGDIVCQGTLAILAQGKIFGEMQCAKIIVEEGGLLQGENRMTSS